MHIKKHSPLRLCFLICILEEIFCVIYISYFSIIPKCNRVSGLFMHTLMQWKYATKSGASAA